MDDPALKLLQARRVIESQQRERVRLEQQVRKQDLELRRLRRAVTVLHLRIHNMREEDADVTGSAT